jgi:hypothetical protein
MTLTALNENKTGRDDQKSATERFSSSQNHGHDLLAEQGLDEGFIARNGPLIHHLP